MKNVIAAKESLRDMPPRSEDELDPVTLHNKVELFLFLPFHVAPLQT